MLATANTGKNRERFFKNAGEWTGRVEMSKEETPGSERSMYGYILAYQALKGERLSAVFSPDGTLISASAAPHCGKSSMARQSKVDKYILLCIHLVRYQGRFDSLLTL